MKTMVFRLAFVLALAGMVSVAGASTIQTGEVRTVTGKVSAVDAGAGVLVMEAPTAKGMLTVGVTMKEGAPITKDKRKVTLDDLKVDETVTLKYTRENGRLIGLAVRAR